MYRYGQGVSKDEKAAVKWFLLSADQGLAFSQINLGQMYSLGLGVAQDFEEAFKWMSRAAEQGYPEVPTVNPG